MPKISCILTSYNQPKWLEQAVLSVLDQTYQDFELLLMDDNSPDSNVQKTLAKYDSHPKVQVFVSDVTPQERMLSCRYSHQINTALYYSQGQYITYLTDDDYYLPSRFELMVETMKNPNIHVVFGHQLLQVADDEPYGLRRTPTEEIHDAYDIIDHNSVMHCRHIYEEVGDWTENPIHWRGADGQYWRKITGAGYSFHPMNPQAITEVHRFHSGSVRHKLLEQGITDLN